MATQVFPGRGDGPPAVPMDDVMRQMIAERLLDGAEADELARGLANLTRLPLAEIEREIQAALDSPYLLAAARFHARLQKWDWVLQNRARLAADDPDGLTVPQLTRPEAATFYRDHYLAHRPVLVHGLIDHWPARANWSLDYVADRLGETRVHVQWDREAHPDYESSSSKYRTDRPFTEIAERLRAPDPSNDFYVTANNSGENRAAFAPLFEDVGEMPEILAPGGAKQGFIWIGPRGTVTPWHHDLTNNLLLQVVGRKRVRMVASHDTPKMRNHRHCFSQWGSTDLLPGSAQGAKPAVLECVLEPGDALFLPIGWWHHVEGLDQTIGMSFTAFRWNNDFYSSYHSFTDL